jgi:hypothetical protein
MRACHALSAVALIFAVRGLTLLSLRAALLGMPLSVAELPGFNCSLADTYWPGRAGSITVDTEALSNLFGLNQVISQCQENTAPDDKGNNLMAQARAMNQNFYGEYETTESLPWPLKMVRDYRTADDFRFFIARYKSALVPGIPVESCNFEKRRYNLRFAPRCDFYYDRQTSLLCREVEGRCVNSSAPATLKRPDLCYINVRGTEPNLRGVKTVYADGEIEQVSLERPYDCSNCRAHKGFWTQAKRFWQQLKKDALEWGCQHFVMSGHSLGAAVGSLIAWQAHRDYPRADVTSYGWESPRYLNYEFSIIYNEEIPSLRTTHQVYFDESDDLHSVDIVPQVPLWAPSWFGVKYYYHTGWEILFRDPRKDGRQHGPACCPMICDSVSRGTAHYDAKCQCSRFYGGDTVYVQDYLGYWVENAERLNVLHGDFENTEIQANLRAEEACPFRALPPDDNATNFCYLSHRPGAGCESIQAILGCANSTAVSKVVGCVSGGQCGFRAGQGPCVASPESVQWLRGEAYCSCGAAV